MKINKNELQKALEIVKPGLANNEVIEQSTSFAFMGNRVVTYNDEISISHPIEGMKITGAIYADILYQFLNKIKKEEIEIEITENELILSSGKARACITLQSEITLPLEEIEKIGKWQELDNEFFTALSFVSESASSEISKPIITCIHCQDNIVEASDGYQAARYKLKSKISGDLLIPKRIIHNFAKLNPNEISIGNNWVHFRTKENTVISCRVFEDEFPEIGPHLKTKGSTITFPKTMDQILERVRVFTKQERKMDEWMEIILAENKITVKGKNDYGHFLEEANTRYDKNPVTFYITPLLLQNILTRSSTCILGKDKIRFEGDNWEFIAMLRINK